MPTVTFVPTVPRPDGSYAWSNVENWIPRPPTIGDTVTFTTPYTYTSAMDVASFSVAGQDWLVITIPEGVTLDLRNILRVDNFSSSMGTLISSVLPATNQLYVSDPQTGAIGTLSGSNVNKATINFMGAYISAPYTYSVYDFTFTVASVNLNFENAVGTNNDTMELILTNGNMTANSIAIGSETSLYPDITYPMEIYLLAQTLA